MGNNCKGIEKTMKMWKIDNWRKINICARGIRKGSEKVKKGKKEKQEKGRKREEKEKKGKKEGKYKRNVAKEELEKKIKV